MKETVLDVDVINVLVEGGIFRKVDGSVIVAEDRSGARWHKSYARKQCPYPDLLLTAFVSGGVFCLT